MPCPARHWLEVKMALLSPSPAFIGHRHWVLSISWSPDGKKLASGCKNGQVGDIWMKGQRVASGTLKGVLGGQLGDVWWDRLQKVTL